MSRTNDAIRSIDEIIIKLNDPDASVRSEVAGMAQYAFCGSPGHEKGALLLEAVAAKLELKMNGHAEPVEPDHYVRERCADALRLASDRFNIAKFVPLLQLSCSKDPHEWVREMAGGALEAIGRKAPAPETSDLPLPKSWTTRPSAPSQSHIRELAPSSAEKEKRLRA